MSVKTTRTRKASSRRQRASDDLAREYRFDYSRSRPNRFARYSQGEVLAVVLDADVAEVFSDPRQVNSFLRATISALKADGPRRGLTRSTRRAPASRRLRKGSKRRATGRGRAG